MMWMNLETIIQSEVSQKQKDKYHILTHIYIYGIQKNGTEEFICRSSKKQESSRKTSISALLTMPKPLTVQITVNCGQF